MAKVMFFFIREIKDFPHGEELNAKELELTNCSSLSLPFGLANESEEREGRSPLFAERIRSQNQHKKKKVRTKR